MNRLIKHSIMRLFLFAIAVLSLSTLPLFFTNIAYAGPTIPVLVDYFDTGTFSSLNAEGITYISTTGDFAIVDSVEDKVFIVNRLGVKLSEFSTTGFGSSWPSGIAFIPSTGNFAIVDDSADDVFIVNSSGTLQYSFDIHTFSTYPQGITYYTDSADNGYFAITDNSADEVFIVDSSGVLQHNFDTSGFSSAPNGIVYLPNGDYAIVDSNTDEVYIVNYSSGTGIVTQIDHFDTYFVSGYPTGITFDSDEGNFYIVDLAADEVFALNAEGYELKQFSTFTFGCTSPTGITHIDGTNNFAIVDDVANDIFIVNSDGNLQSQCDISALPADHPSGIAYIPVTGVHFLSATNNTASSVAGFAIVDSNFRELFITDTNCSLLEQFDTATFGINSLSPSGITYLSPNEFTITDSSKYTSFIFDTSLPGKLQGQFGHYMLGATTCRGITLIPSTGNYALLSDGVDEVFILNFDGALQARFDTSSFSLYPSGITFDADNEVFAIVDNQDAEVTLLVLPCLTRLPESGTVFVGGPIVPSQAANAHNKIIPDKKRSKF